MNNLLKRCKCFFFIQVQEPEKLKWICGTCTFWNLPLRPSCEQCSCERPADFEIPVNYVPEPEEQAFLDATEASRQQLDQVLD